MVRLCTKQADLRYCTRAVLCSPLGRQNSTRFFKVLSGIISTCILTYLSHFPEPSPVGSTTEPTFDISFMMALFVSCPKGRWCSCTQSRTRQSLPCAPFSFVVSNFIARRSCRKCQGHRLSTLCLSSGEMNSATKRPSEDRVSALIPKLYQHLNKASLRNWQLTGRSVITRNKIHFVQSVSFISRSARHTCLLLLGRITRASIYFMRSAWLLIDEVIVCFVVVAMRIW
jgi:hypothetical protein